MQSSASSFGPEQVLMYRTMRKRTLDANVKRLRRLEREGKATPLPKERMDRLRFCSDRVLIGQDPESGKTVTASRTCHDRLCPICEAQEARKRFVQLSKVMDRLRREKDETGKPKYYFLKGCFTVPNVPLDQLADKTSQMSKAVSKMNSHYFKRHGSLGMWISSEFSYNPVRDDYHPHIHFIMIMPYSYKGSKGTSQWLEAKTVREHFMDYMHQYDIQDFDFGALHFDWKDKDGSSHRGDSLFEFVKYNSKPMTQELQKKLKYSGVLEEKYLDGVLLGKLAVYHSCHIRSTGVVKEALAIVKREMSKDDEYVGKLWYNENGTVALNFETPSDLPRSAEDECVDGKTDIFRSLGDTNTVTYHEFVWHPGQQIYIQTPATFHFMLSSASDSGGHLDDVSKAYYNYANKCFAFMVHLTGLDPQSRIEWWNQKTS